MATPNNVTTSAINYQNAGNLTGDAASQNSALANIINPPAKIPDAPPAKADYTQALIKQILGQNTSSRWTGQGHGSAQANAADMAKILSDIGISDIKQFGKFTKTGINETVTPDGKGGFVDQRGKAVDPKLVSSQMAGESEGGYYTEYVAPIGTQEVFGNKVTKQEVPVTYSGRQSGNFFGGTYAGKGNTGYGVQFDSQGNPIFYTQGASSNDLVNMLQGNPLLTAIAQAGAAYIGGPAGTAALAAAMGKKPADILKSAALSFAGGKLGSAISGAEGITNVLGEAGTKIAANTAKNIVSSGGKVDPVQALLNNVINSGVDKFSSSVFGADNLIPKELQGILTTAAKAKLAGQPVNQSIVNSVARQALSTNDGSESNQVATAPAATPAIPATQYAAAPIQSDTSPIQLMTDVFGTDISRAQKSGARGYEFSGGGNIDELLQLLRS